MNQNTWEPTETENVFTLDISETEGAQDVPCAGCGMSLPLKWFQTLRNRENEILKWDLRHICGANMTIFND